jgi:glycosyltransferase involved in cell wall biosynthesis
MRPISVVIPTRDRRELVLACVASVLAQTRRPDEILVVDNGSRDGTLDALRRLEGIKVLREPRPGVSHARNRGIESARGELVAFIDDDAAAAPDWLERLAACVESTGALGAGGPAEPVWEVPPPSWLSASPKALSAIGAFSLGAARRPLSGPHDFLIGTNCAFRRSVFEAGHRFLYIGPGRPGFGLEDVEFSSRIGRLGPVLYEPAARVFHRIPGRKLSLAHLAACSFDNGRKKAAVGRPLLPGRRKNFQPVDAWMTAFLTAGYVLQSALRTR